MGKRTKKGGAYYDIYCYACGLPLASYSSEALKYSDITNSQKNQIKSDLANVNMDWLEHSIGFDSEHDMFFNLGSYSGEDGIMPFDVQQDYPGATEFLDTSNVYGFRTNDEDIDDEYNENENEEPEVKVSGIVMHRDCLKILQDATGNRITPGDEDTLIESVRRPCFSGHQYQFYEWEKEILEHGGGKFKSPRENIELKETILDCMEPFIAEILATKNNIVVRRNNTNVRSLPANAINTITHGNIQDGNNMVNFQNEFKYGRFYTKNTYDKFKLKQNPVTREPIKEVKSYKASVRKTRKGGKRRINQKKRATYRKKNI
jgi:hypothetical protein